MMTIPTGGMPLPFGLGFLPVIDVNEHGIFVVFDALDKGCEESFDEKGVNTSFGLIFTWETYLLLGVVL